MGRQKDRKPFLCSEPFEERNDGTTGIIIGAATGGVVGNVIGGRGNRTVGTILGAAGGALLGRHIDRKNYRCR